MAGGQSGQIFHTAFGILKGAALLLAHQALDGYLRPWLISCSPDSEFFDQSFGLNIYSYFHLYFRSSLMEKLWNLGVSQLMLEDGMCRSA